MSAPARFSNRQNERHELPGGRVLFESRSVAVTAVIVGRAADGTFHAVAGLRGPRVDKSGSWCLPCGYLDWDESLRDAVRREVFEEAGLDLAALEARGEAWLSPQPIVVESAPTAHRQNVTARFIVSLTHLAPLSIANAEPGEVERIEWLPLTDAIDARPWAFEHDQILRGLRVFLEGEASAGRADTAGPRRYYRAIRDAEG